MINSIITMVDSTTEGTIVEKIYFKESCVLDQKQFMQIVDKYLQATDTDISLEELQKNGAEIQTTANKCVIKDPHAKTREFPGTTIFNLDYIYL